jgi:hypothetical protein
LSTDLKEKLPSRVFDREKSGKLSLMNGPKMVIRLKEGVVPHYEGCARNVSLPDLADVKRKLDALLSQGSGRRHRSIKLHMR